MEREENSGTLDSGTAPKMRGNRATQMRAMNSRFGSAHVPVHFNNSTQQAMAKNKTVTANMKADLKISHREQKRVIERLHRTQTELHSKLITLAERQSELAKETEMRKQQQGREKRRNTESKKEEADAADNKVEQAEHDPVQEATVRLPSESQDDTRSSLPTDPDTDNDPLNSSPNASVKDSKRQGENEEILEESSRPGTMSGNMSLKKKEKFKESDPRTDLKQKVRRVRFFLPFTGELESEQNQTDRRQLDGDLIHEQGNRGVVGKNEKSSFGNLEKLTGNEVSQTSRDGSIGSSGNKRSSSASSVNIKNKYGDNRMLSASPKLLQLRQDMKTIEKQENRSKSYSPQPDRREVLRYKASRDGQFVPLLIPYRRRTFPVPRAEETVRRLQMLEREADFVSARVQKSDQLLQQVQKTVGNPRRKVSIMISDELVDMPHLPDIEVQEQEEGVIPRKHPSSPSSAQYRSSSLNRQRAASVSTATPQKSPSQNSNLRSTSASAASGSSAIYRLDNLKGKRNTTRERRVSIASANGNGARTQSANRNFGNVAVSTTFGHLLNTLDSRLPDNDRDSDSIQALRDCRYIRIYSPALKRSKDYRRVSSWNMPGAPSSAHNHGYLMSS